MEFIHNVVGPDFDQADLVTFDFSNVDVILPLPEHWGGEGQQFLAPTDLTHIAAEQWFADGAGNNALRLVEHRWAYKNKRNGLEDFLTDLDVLVYELPAEKQSQSVSLNKPAFCNWILESMHKWAVQ